jgi:glucan phosphoethanolaminetransferase (alkaline phosphatase superfamily)
MGTYSLARLFFFAAWMVPTACLIDGGLPIERIVAAFCATAVSGVLLAGLPSPGFRIARLLLTLCLPLSLLWIGYVSLNGMGPTSADAAGALAHTNPAEALTAVRLLANYKSVFVGLCQVSLIGASYACTLPRESPYAAGIFAGSLLVVMVNAWIPRLVHPVPAFLPGRDDLQNVPYGAVADLIDSLVDQQEIMASRSTGGGRRIADEAHVADRIDAIFVLGETFRYDALKNLKSGALDSLRQRVAGGLGVILPKVCASADSTAVSVPMLLTGTSPEHQPDAATAPSGLARLAAAGYRTAFISNQGLHFFSDEKRDFVWNAKGYANQYDDAMLPIASTFMARNSQVNKAVVIHLMDSHAAYEDRYPPTAEPVGLDKEQTEALRYSRANAHTLEVLDHIAAMIDALPTPAFVVYVSDHGENLWADHNGMHFHISARTTAVAGYVPSFVLWNAAFARAYQPTARLQRLLAAPSVAHVDVFAIWMNFAGLSTEPSPSDQPKIFGKAMLTDPVAAIPCSTLAP